MPYRPPRPAPPQPPGSGPVTGLDVVRASGARYVIGQSGEDCCFAWREQVIVLSPEVASGTDIRSLIIAAEEVAHHDQPRWWHALRWLQPMRWLAEADAFFRVKAWLRGFGQ